jgi:uncharacterized protein (DUF362 family)/Pyruvate/2-oxoacid:ferredoxin oxidoreductase delta subunit
LKKGWICVAKVALVNCNDYSYENVKSALLKGINLIGGIDKYARKGENILLKPNLLKADLPDKCSVTNHTVVKATAEIFKEKDVNLSYGDSPGIHKSSYAATKTGLKESMDSISIPQADFDEGREIYFADGIQNKKFIIANGVLDCDGIISISKLKTHGLTRMTGAVKNQFGCIPGKLKAEFHVRLPDPTNFCRMLVDLTKYLKPRLYIMDAIVAMEGNGPGSGTPRKLNLLLLSTDPIALDTIACRIIGLNPKNVPTNLLGHEAGLGTYIENEIDIVGDSIESFVVTDFSVVNRPTISIFSGNILLSLLKGLIVAKPFIISRKCIKCGVCIQACPVKDKAIFQGKNKSAPPIYNYSKCIRCYCCQEMCPEGAIEIKLPLLRKLFNRK